jgi:hypothetical protein
VFISFSSYCKMLGFEPVRQFVTVTVVEKMGYLVRCEAREVNGKREGEKGVIG